MRIGADLDGCLVNFNEAYRDLIKLKTGIILPEMGTDYPDCWDYAEVAGVRGKLRNMVWDHIKQDANKFWAHLPPYVGTKDALRMLANLRYEGDDIYFITSRPGHGAKAQTEYWLLNQGFSCPTVLISSDKGSVAKGLELDVFCDDKPENCAEVHLASPKTTVYMIRQPYNRLYNTANDSPIVSADSVVEVLGRYAKKEAA